MSLMMLVCLVSEAQVSTLAPSPTKPIRQLDSSVPWPDVDIAIEKSISSEAQLTKLSDAEKIKHVSDYCEESTLAYVNKAKKNLQVKSFSNFFAKSCEGVIFKIKRSDSLRSLQNLSEINLLILNTLDANFSYVYYSPMYNFWKSSEEYQSSYNSSLFGLIGIPFKQSIILTQIAVLIALIVAIAAILKKA